MTDLAQARDHLGRRQEQVLGALLAGQVPPGFDPRTTIAAGAQLRGKRRHEAVRARPRLIDLPGLVEVFDDYARSTPRAGCAHDDADAFARWLSDAALPAATVDWVAEQRVRAGEQRCALVHGHGRRVLLLGLGARVWRLAVRPPQTDDDVRRRRG